MSDVPGTADRPSAADVLEWLVETARETGLDRVHSPVGRLQRRFRVQQAIVLRRLAELELGGAIEWRPGGIGWVRLCAPRAG